MIAGNKKRELLEVGPVCNPGKDCKLGGVFTEVELTARSPVGGNQSAQGAIGSWLPISLNVTSQSSRVRSSGGNRDYSGAHLINTRALETNKNRDILVMPMTIHARSLGGKGVPDESFHCR